MQSDLDFQIPELVAFMWKNKWWKWMTFSNGC